MTKAVAPLRILLSAYGCEPDRGSEPGVGWNWAMALLRRGHQVWVLTRTNNVEVIEAACRRQGIALNETFHVIGHDLPGWVRWLKRKGMPTQLYYSLWQRSIFKVAKAAHEQHRFTHCQHITFGVWRQASRLHQLGIPFIFGPVGGGEEAPVSLTREFGLRDKAKDRLRLALNRINVYNPWLRNCLHASAQVLAKTPESADWLRRTGATKVQCLLEIGIEPSQIQPRPTATSSSAATPLRCLFAGRMVAFKGLELGIDALARAIAQGADISLTVVGTGPGETRSRQRALRAGISDRVRYLGKLPQRLLFEQYLEHDLLLFPSLHDSSGNVVLEAFAHGVPVLCLKLGGPGVMVNDRNGLAVPVAKDATPARCSADLGAALLHFWHNRSDLAARSAGAYATARRMTWDAAAKQTYAPFEALVLSEQKR